MNASRWPVWILLLSSIGWGLTWIPLQFFEAKGLSGPSLVFLVFLSASILLTPVMLYQWRSWIEEWQHIALIFLFGGLANLLFQLAMFYGDVVRVMILFYLLPVWSVLGGRIVLGEKIDAIRWLTLGAALAGGILILGGLSVFKTPPDWIDLMAIGAGFAFAMNNLVFRVSQAIPLTEKVGAIFLGGTLICGAYLLTQPDFTLEQDATLTGYAALYGIVWLGIITFGTQWGVTHLEAGRASIIIVMELVVAVVSAMLLLGKVLSPIEMVGAFLVVSAAIIEGFREQASH